MLGARYRDIEPTVKSLMPPMLLLTPILWKPEMLGEYSFLIYANPFTYFVGIVRNDLIGLASLHPRVEGLRANEIIC